MSEDAVLAAARGAQASAYAPYSRYQVGAAIEAEDGRIFAGCNVENASYGLTICAERGAVMTGVAAGATHFRRVVVVTDSEPPAAPCGACRQFLAEFGPDLEVEAVGPRSTRRWRLSELLPASFDKGFLER
ncbi:MAG: cytidine deaminase [Gemmatimonadales bacterium]